MPHPVISYLQVSLHLLIRDSQEGLTSSGVTEAAGSHMNVVKTRHPVHLSGEEETL